jgi:hypothetical protein
MAMISKNNPVAHRPGRNESGKEAALRRARPADEPSPLDGKTGGFGSDGPASCQALVAVSAGGETPVVDGELLLLRERAFAEIGALRSEIERLAGMKEQTRSDLRRLLEDCLARLDAGGAGLDRAAGDEPPPASPATAAGADGLSHPFSRLLQGLAAPLCNPLRRRLAVAGWEQAPMLLVVTLIILQELVPTIQRMALLG